MRGGIVRLSKHLILKVHRAHAMTAFSEFMITMHGTCGVNIDLRGICGSQRVANTRSETARIGVSWQFCQLERRHGFLFLVAFGCCGNQSPDVVADQSSSSDTVPTASFESQMRHEPHVLVFEGIGSQEVSHVKEKVSVTIDAGHQGDHLRVAQLYSGMYSLTWLIHIL